MKIKKTMNVAKVLGLTACCVLLNSCGDDDKAATASTNSGDSCVGVGSPSLSVKVNRDGGTQWTTLTAGGSLSDSAGDSVFNVAVNCRAPENDFIFKLVNSGTGCLRKNGTALQVTKTTTTDDPDSVFSVVTEPTLPLAPGESVEFKVRLASSNCSLGGNRFEASAPGSWSDSHERFKITVNTNDPTNPTFDSSLHVFGNS